MWIIDLVVHVDIPRDYCLNRHVRVEIKNNSPPPPLLSPQLGPKDHRLLVSIFYILIYEGISLPWELEKGRKKFAGSRIGAVVKVLTEEGNTH